MLQSLPLPSRIKENFPIEWRDLWNLWFLIIVILHIRMKRQIFQVKDPPLTSESVMIYKTLLFLVWLLGLSLLLITVFVLCYCNSYHCIIRGGKKSLWKCHSTIQYQNKQICILFLCYINQCLAHLPKEMKWTRIHCNYYMIFRKIF